MKARVAGVAGMMLLFFTCGQGMKNLTGAPTITIIANTHDFIGSGGGYSSTKLTWTTNRQGEFAVSRNAGCDRGSALQGNPAFFGSVSAFQVVATNITAADLIPGRNEITICVNDAVNGKTSTARYFLTRDDHAPVVTILGNQYEGISTAAAAGVNTTTDVSWQADVTGYYSVVINGACTGGAKSSGAGNSGTTSPGSTLVSTIAASDLYQGINLIRVCVDDVQTNAHGEATINILRDDAAPVTVADKGAGIYGKKVFVNLTCSDNEDKIAYTCSNAAGSEGCSTTGLDPEFDADGNIAVGADYTPLKTASPLTGWGAPFTAGSVDTVTELRFRCRDKAGRVEAVKSFIYRTNDSYPTVTVNAGGVTRSYVSNSGGYASTAITWQFDASGTGARPYEVRVGGNDCATGSLPTGTNISGNVAKLTNVTTTLPASVFATGNNTVRICVALAVTGFTSLIIVRDDTPPFSTASSPGGNYGAVQNIVLSCSDAQNNCDRVVYRIDAADPDFDGAGNPTAGSIVYNTPWPTPNNEPPGDTTPTQLRFRAVDLAGNKEAIRSETYNIRPDLYKLSITQIVHNNIPPTVLPQDIPIPVTLSTNGGYASATIRWLTSYPGLNYYVRIGGTDCSDASSSFGANASGVTLANTAVYSVIEAADLSIAGHTIRICLQDQASAFAALTATIVNDGLPRWDLALFDTHTWGP